MAVPGTGSTNQSLTMAAAKRLAGKAHTSNQKEIYDEIIPSNIQVSTKTIFAESIPQTVTRTLYSRFSASAGQPYTAEFVEFHIETVSVTTYEADTGTFGDVGFGGGDEIVGNLLLNCVRESADHGPWNSWSRVPYITNLRTGRPSIIPATRHIHHNFIFANYYSFSAVDTDDGSAYYEVANNFFAYGQHGLKSDFGGHDLVYSGNVQAYVGNCRHLPYNGEYKGYNDGYVENTCIFTQSYDSDCQVVAGFTVHDNRVFSKTGTLSVCGMNFSQWQAEGHDKGTTVGVWPSDEAVVAMGWAVLGGMPARAE